MFLVVPTNEEQDKTKGSNHQTENSVASDTRHGYLHNYPERRMPSNVDFHLDNGVGVQNVVRVIT